MSAIRIASGAVLAATLVLAPGRVIGADGAAAPAHWRWPTAPPGAIVQPFEAPPSAYAAGHRGIDLAASAGQQVLAPTTAVVQFAGVVVDRPVVTLRVDAHVLVSFEPVDASVPVGASIAAGQPFGAVGHGGHCDRNCLHVGVRVDGDYVSPLVFYAGVPPAVLLPLN